MPIFMNYSLADGTVSPTIEVLSFSFGINNTVQIGSATGGAGDGKVNFKEFKITKKTDDASVALLRLCDGGTHITRATISERKAGGREPFLEFEFGLVLLSTIDWSGSGGDESPTESVTFVYGALQVLHKGADGRSDQASFDTSQAIYYTPFPPRGW